MSEIFEREIAGRTLSMEVGKLAGLANGAVTVRYGDTVVLVTACMSQTPREGIDFFPLTVDFEERLYAVGKIPGGFFRREGRPSTAGILTARLTDRPLRPLFPKGMRNDVQIIVTTLSADQENDPDMLLRSSAPPRRFRSPTSPSMGPVSGDPHRLHVTTSSSSTRRSQQLDDSTLDIVVAGTQGCHRDGRGRRQRGLRGDPDLEAMKLAQEVNAEIIALQEEMVAAYRQAEV